MALQAHIQSSIRPNVTAAELADWAGDTYPAGDWHADRVEVYNLDYVLNALKQFGKAEFSAVYTPSGIILRMARNLKQTPVKRVSATYPVEPERGPMARWTEAGELDALKHFVISRMQFTETGQATIRVQRADLLLQRITRFDVLG